MSQSIMPMISDGVDDIEADKKSDAPATWRSLPQKYQIGILGLCRFVDFLQISSLQAYIFFQLKSFDPTLEDFEIARQAGILQGSFTATQCFTAVLWGRAADTPWCGRKIVLLVGLLSTALSCFGLGFSLSFSQAIFFRIIGGALNGTVGIVRTMISENVKDKKYQSHAFLVLPMSFNLAALIGPVIGGFSAGSTGPYPEMIKFKSKYDGNSTDPVSFPYALPSAINAMLLLAITLTVYFGLEETLESYSGRFDTGRYSYKFIISTLSYFRLILFRKKVSKNMKEYETLTPYTHITVDSAIRNESQLADDKRISRELKESDLRLPFHRMWTWSVVSMLLAQALFDFHLGVFSSILPLFLSAPIQKQENHNQYILAQAPSYAFTGGLGMPAASVGIALGIFGAVGLILQFILYPMLHSRLGTVNCFRLFSAFFPVGYLAMPVLTILPSKALLWVGIVVVLTILVAARTFTLPATIVILNNCSPHPSVLGTVHAIGQSVSAASRTIGSIVGGYWYARGLQNGSSGEAWWEVSIIAIAGFFAACLVTEGSS